MRRVCFTLLLAVLAAGQARAHFVFLVPATDGRSIQVVFSDDLARDENVTIAKITPIKLHARVQGKDTPVAHQAEKHQLVGSIPAGSTLLYGTISYGLPTRGKEPFLLVYHPKVVLAGGSGQAATVGTQAVAEIVPVTANGKTHFQLLAAGKPVAGATGAVRLPDGEQEKVTTDKDGCTPAFPGHGRFGVWLRHTEKKAGEFNGTKYQEVRHYPTLVAEVAPASLPALPVAVASHGAIVSDGYLYVYGGHSGKTHTYSNKDVIGTFQRLKLAGGTRWEALPGGPIAQGMNLTAHRGQVIRVGGMQPRNEPGQPADNHSLTACAAYHPATGKWSALPALPSGRSSHDVVTVGDKLVVVGGWDQKGAGEKPVWHDTTAVLDLAAKGPQWRTLPQPFQRRALTAVASGSKVYVLGGLTAEGSASPRVDILDTTTGKWTTGPDLPGKSRVGFSPAATVVGTRLIVSTSDGEINALSTSGTAWTKVGQSKTKRRVHRLVPHGDGVLLVGGATGGGMIADLEFVSLASKRASVSAASPSK